MGTIPQSAAPPAPSLREPFLFVFCKTANTTKKKKEEHRMKHDDPFYDQETTVSATECTGLIPAGIDTEEEAENYADLYSVHSQTVNVP